MTISVDCDIAVVNKELINMLIRQSQMYRIESILSGF